MKGLINESIRVSVCCALCVCAMQSGPDVPSLRAHRGKGCHCWQAWWMGGTSLRDKDECDSPHPAKRGWCSTTSGRSCDADHLPFLVLSPAGWAQDGERSTEKKKARAEYQNILFRGRLVLSPITSLTKDLKAAERVGATKYTNTKAWMQYLIRALDRITGLNKHQGIHQ